MESVSREGEAGRVAELEKRLKEAETERDILKKSFSIISTSDRWSFNLSKDYNSREWTIGMDGVEYWKMYLVAVITAGLKDPVGKRKRKSMKLSREIKDGIFQSQGTPNGSPRCG